MADLTTYVHPSRGPLEIGMRLIRGHAQVFEYEVLTCASTVRFQLETPPPATLFEEVTRPTPRWPSHRGMDHRANVTSPDSPRPRAPGKLASFPRLSPPPGRPACVSLSVTTTLTPSCDAFSAGTYPAKHTGSSTGATHLRIRARPAAGLSRRNAPTLWL